VGGPALKLRTITLDFWGTLLVDGPASDNRYKKRRMADFAKILAAAGERVSSGQLDRAYDESGTFLALVWSRQRDVPVGDHVRAILTALDRQLPGRVTAEVMTMLVDAYSRPALLVPPAVDEGALAALETLAARGYTLALVSNTMRTPGATLRKVLERYRLLGCFKHTTFSDEVGVRKPDPEIFALTLRAVAGEAASAVHVGDDDILDVKGARGAGMRTIQVTSHSLEALGAQRPDAAIPRLADLPRAIARLEA
jgi:putative hydrolase of the HAD superfamily